MGSERFQMTSPRPLKELQQRIRFRETRLRFLHQAPPSVVGFETQVIKDLKAQLHQRCRQVALSLGVL